jgi:protein-L-isoaspartate O-methyltransferase
VTAFDHSVVSPAAFENRYRENPDPWNYQASPYERSKYAVTIDSLSRERFASAFEPACSVGELTAMLASRCDRLLATDVSETAVRRARRRCADLSNVTVECRDLRTEVRSDSEAHAHRQGFDLIVFSEVGYYFDVASLSALARRLAESLNSGGEFIAVHWRGHSADHVIHGDEVHRSLFDSLPLQHRLGDYHPGFRLDSWLKA